MDNMTQEHKSHREVFYMPEDGPPQAVVFPHTTGLIHQAIPAMIAEVGHIGKDKKNQQQGFMYRGVDSVYAAVQPLLARHGVYLTTNVIDEKREEREGRNGGTIFYSRLTVRFTFYAKDGSNVSSTIIGEAMDSGDKATNKSLSIAFKYALFQILCIPCEETAIDPDKDIHEPIPKKSDTFTQAMKAITEAKNLERVDTILATVAERHREKKVSDSEKRELDSAGATRRKELA